MTAFVPCPVRAPRAAVAPRAGLCVCKTSVPEAAASAADAVFKSAALAVAGAALAGVCTLLVAPAPETANALGIMRLPPINRSDRNRCVPSSSAIGQANAARDSVLDLRECDLRGVDLTSYDLSGGILADANLQDAKLVDSHLSKAYLPNAVLRGVDFTNAVVDRANFDGADLRGAIFANAVLSDSTFESANLEGVDFTEVYISDFSQRDICRNPTAKGENPVTGVSTRESLGCR